MGGDFSSKLGIRGADGWEETFPVLLVGTSAYEDFVCSDSGLVGTPRAKRKRGLGNETSRTVP